MKNLNILLKTPIYRNSSEEIILATAENTMACESIAEKLSEVSSIAESLDNLLRDTQEGLDLFENDITGSPILPSDSERKSSSANNSDVCVSKNFPNSITVFKIKFSICRIGVAA